MGNDQSIENEQTTQKIPLQQLRIMVLNSIKQKKIHFSQSQNLFEILQYLASNLGVFDFDQLLLNNCKITIKQMQMLAKMDTKVARQKIKVLNLSHNQLTSESIKPIITLHLINLTTLYLDHNNISTDGCYYLTKPKLQSLQTLDLTGNQIDDQGCRVLAGAGNWPELRTLLISQNKFTTKGLLYLSKGQWPVLIFAKANKNSFQPSQKLSETKFRTQIKGFTLQLY